MHISDDEQISTYDIFVNNFNIDSDHKLSVGDVREIVAALQSKIKAIDEVNVDDLSNKVVP